MRSKSQILSKLRADGHITDEEYKALEQEPCDNCEVGNPCLYCKHEFEPQERSE